MGLFGRNKGGSNVKKITRVDGVVQNYHVGTAGKSIIPTAADPHSLVPAPAESSPPAVDEAAAALQRMSIVARQRTYASHTALPTGSTRELHDDIMSFYVAIREEYQRVGPEIDQGKPERVFRGLRAEGYDKGIPAPTTEEVCSHIDSLVRKVNASRTLNEQEKTHLAWSLAVAKKHAGSVDGPTWYAWTHLDAQMKDNDSFTMLSQRWNSDARTKEFNDIAVKGQADTSAGPDWQRWSTEIAKRGFSSE